MHMHNLTFDTNRHHYAFGKYDRITIEGQIYRTSLYGRNEEGWLLELDDGSGRCSSFTHQKLSRLGSMRRIRVEHNFYAPESSRQRLLTGGILISELSAKPAARLTKKHAYIEAFFEMERQNLINRTDAAIDANKFELRGRAMDYATQFQGGEGTQQSLDFSKCPSPRTLRRWLAEHRKAGVSGLVDAMNRRGNRNRLMGPEQNALMMREVKRYASEDRPNIRTIHENVSIAFEARNQARVADGLHPFPVPSYETVRRAIHMLDPFEVEVAREGIEAARKKFMPVGEGLRPTRPLERVEIDENTIDIISLTESWGLRELLTDEEQKILGLDRGKARWFVTVAICATTRCIVGMAFSRSAKEKASLQVLQMILRDKGKWADAAGSLGSWDMHGTPILIVTDNGPAFKSELFRTACADLGITTLRAPAGLPQMRARNERFFHSLNTGLLPRLPGRTFSSVREKGDADPEARAALTFDDLAFCLVRWIVDIYHNAPHAGLGGETPLNCWRRLTAEWGVQPPPDMGLHRVIFGERLPRKLSREGVSVMGLRYHSEALAQLMTKREERDVEVRWHPDDIGRVTVYAGEHKFEVGTVLSGFDGMSARQWVAATRRLKAANAGRKTYDQEMIHAAITAIEARSTAAAQMAGLLVDEWTPERIRGFEASLYIGFNVGGKKSAQPAATDGIGRSIPDLEIHAPLPALPVAGPAAKNLDLPDASPVTQPWSITE
ncbi:Mu transposase C-terminal domain-containing protein [Falsirhodobacter halotolerans]|uniref:Mu transposase C-terminal domain-containing protein n=1 Tax=Falsirhodobacter halotolerans TaxID=1146892 RepID=UPI001FD28A6D|nr:Mu transposase C-terminal domain-containing protein [Falsirhodobacter halotolerans]MCJ8141048.1 Mu transposase C-terminal domain-containing protein [Falsirhodobacter halotolerans]